VTVISSSPDKKEQALAFGANNFIVSNDRKAVRQHDFEFDLLLCTATGQLPWTLLLNILKKEGRIIVVGFPEISMEPRDLVTHNLSIIGSFIGNHATMREMLLFAQAHRITPLIELIPMSQINEALQRVKENKARYRIVLVNEPAGG
jgi:D-arabinose 1-dehydrogenase-like Zn-dependent alcohol dehydrogenase